MERKVDGFDEELAVVMAYDDQGKTSSLVCPSLFGRVNTPFDNPNHS
jgi:hypothetical protein